MRYIHSLHDSPEKTSVIYETTMKMTVRILTPRLSAIVVAITYFAPNE